MFRLAWVGIEVRSLAKFLYHRPLPHLFLVVACGSALALAVATQSTARSILFRPLGVPAAEDLYQVLEWEKGSAPSRRIDLARTDVLTSQLPGSMLLALFDDFSAAIDTPAGAQVVRGHAVSLKFFSTVQLSPGIGRLLESPDFNALATPAGVISDRLWRAQFSEDREVIGKAVKLHGRFITIVGVLPRGFRGFAATALSPTDIWIPLPHAATIGVQTTAGIPRVQLLVRDPSGPLSTQTRLRDLWQLTNSTTSTSDLIVRRLDVAFSERTDAVLTGILRLVQAMILAVLIAAGIAVSADLMGTTATRLRAVRIKTSLGAPLSAIIFFIAAPYLCIVAAATAIAVLGGRAVAETLLWWISDAVPLATPTGPELSFAWVDVGSLATVAAVVGLIAVVVPSAIVVGREHRTDRLSQEQIHGRGRRSRWHAALLTVQVALSLVLAFGALLCAMIVKDSETGTLGYRPTATAFVTLDFGAQGLESSAASELAMRIKAVVQNEFGQDSVALADWPAFGLSVETAGLRLPSRAGGRTSIARVQRFDAHAGDLIGLVAVKGRLFAAADFTEDPSVALVDTATAHRHWPWADPIGQGITVEIGGWAGRTRPVPYQVVGVFEQLRDQPVEMQNHDRVILPITNSSSNGGVQQVSFHVDTRALGPAGVERLRRMLATSLPDSPIVTSMSLAAYSRRSNGPTLAAGRLSAVAAATVLFVSVIGLWTSLRRRLNDGAREWALRAALGASRWRIARDVGASEAAVYVGGLAIGSVVAWTAYQFVQRVWPLSKSEAMSTLVWLVIALLAIGGVAIIAPLRALRTTNSAALRTID